MTDANTICHDLDLLDDWLAGKGYGEEAGLVLRALTLIHKQAREIEKLRAALKPFAADTRWLDSEDDDYLCSSIWFRLGQYRAAAAALKVDGDE